MAAQDFCRLVYCRQVLVLAYQVIYAGIYRCKRHWYIRNVSHQPTVSLDIFGCRIGHEFVRAMSQEFVERGQELGEPLSDSPAGLVDHIGA